MKNKFFCGFLLQILLAVSAGGLAADYAQAASPTIAVILPKNPEHMTAIYVAFQEKFAAMTANQPSPTFYLQTPNNDYLSLRNSARKAIALNADIILVFGTSAALAAKAETFHTPVLFADVIEPEAIGLVTDNKSDSQLATGIRGNAPLQTLLKLLRDMTSTLKLAVIVDGDPADKQLIAVIKDAASRRGLEVLPISLRNKTPTAVLRGVAESGADGVMFIKNEEKHVAVLHLALEAKLPTISTVQEMADHGALLVMESSNEEQGEALAGIAVQVLNGEYPEAIPVVSPRKTGIVINLKSAYKCGLQIPFGVLSQATRVIR